MEGASPLLLQKSIKDNSAALQDFLKDLNDWEKEIKDEDEKLSSQSKERGHLSLETGPPVRSKKKLEISSDKGTTENIPGDSKRRKNEQKISAFDYAAWDKFDVDKELASSSEEEQEIKEQSSKKMGETRGPKKSKADKALALKEAGNKFYSNGQLDDAVAKYTQGIALDPTNAVLPANRAMAYIKLKKYTAAEADCNRCLKYDPGYIKAYLRRATSRINLGKTEMAIKDYQKVLQLEPWNKEAKKELDKLECVVDIKGEITKRPEHEIIVKEKIYSEESSPVEESKKHLTDNIHQNQNDDKICDNILSLSNKQEQGGTKLKIVEVNSNKDSTFNTADPDCVLPIEKPPHLISLTTGSGRSPRATGRVFITRMSGSIEEVLPAKPEWSAKIRDDKPLKKIPVVDVATKESIHKQRVSPVAEDTTIQKLPVLPVVEDTTIQNLPVLPVVEYTTIQKLPVLPVVEDTTIQKLPVLPVVEDTTIQKPPVSPVVEDTTIQKPPVSPVVEDTSIQKLPWLPVAEDEDTTVQKYRDADDTIKESQVGETPPSKAEEEIPMSTSLPSLPRTSYQFEQEWNRLSHHVSRAIKYLKIIPPTFLCTVDVESETLVSVISALRSDEVSPTLAAEYLLALSNSSGFSINIMFLDDIQRKVICDTISKCEEAEVYSTPIKNLKNLLDKEL